MNIPRIGPPDCHDFHDSRLLAIEIGPQLDEISVVVQTRPEARYSHSVWDITFHGLLRFAMETIGAGTGPACPLELNDIYVSLGSLQPERWKRRLVQLGLLESEATEVKHVVLANAFFRGWGEFEGSEGLDIICLGFDISPGPSRIGRKYISTAIEGGIDE